MPRKIKILKIGISDVNYDDALEEVKKWLENRTKKHYIVTPNPEILVAAQKNKKLVQVLNRADLALPDGIGLLWASRFLGQPLKEKLTGVDFMEKLCELAEKEGFTVGLIGGENGVAVKTAECLKKRYPGLKIVFVAEEWISPYLPSNNLSIDILFVAFGAPKQEIWISQNLKRLPVKVAMGVGGAFDFLAGVVPRSPRWIQNLGLEWLFRLIRQPSRIKRQLALLKFLFLIWQEKRSSF